MRLQQFAALLLVLGLGALPLTAEQAALTADGDIYRLESHNYGSLFRFGQEAPASAPILALHHTDGLGNERWIPVPATLDTADERVPHLLHDATRDHVTVVWRVGTESAGEIRMQHFDGQEWSELGAAQVGAPNAVEQALTTDAYRLTLDNYEVDTDRTIFHVVWATGNQINYTPLILVEGVYIGWNETFDISSLVDLTATPTPLPAALTGKLDLQVGKSGQSAIAAFGDTESGRIVTLEVSVLPLEVSYFSEQVRDELVALAEQLGSDNPVSLADTLVQSIINIGVHLQLQPALTDYLASEINAWLEDPVNTFGMSIDEAADALHAYTVGLTSGLLAGGSDDNSIIEIDLGDHGDDPGHQLLDVHPITSWPAPQVPDVPATLLTSRDGKRVLIAWLDGPSQIAWVEAAYDSAWSAVRTMAFPASLSIDDALELLQSRLN
ncbi:MAG: hypothetical protein AAGD38_08610 [Acidobacteriota bacterium]